MSDWSGWSGILWPSYPNPECWVVDGDDFVHEMDSYGSAHAYINEMHDQQENMGLPLADYRIIPVRATPGGRDIR